MYTVFDCFADMNFDTSVFDQLSPQLIFLSLWSLFWKGLALWRASRENQRNWFIALLVLNTLGLGEIIYLTWFAKKNRFWDKIVKKQTSGAKSR